MSSHLNINHSRVAWGKSRLKYKLSLWAKITYNFVNELSISNAAKTAQIAVICGKKLFWTNFFWRRPMLRKKLWWQKRNFFHLCWRPKSFFLDNISYRCSTKSNTKAIYLIRFIDKTYCGGKKKRTNLFLSSFDKYRFLTN